MIRRLSNSLSDSVDSFERLKRLGLVLQEICQETSSSDLFERLERYAHQPSAIQFTNSRR